MAHGHRRRLGRIRCLANIIGPERFDPPRAVASVCHRSLPQAGNERAYVFNAPSGGFRPELDGLWESPVLDALPPGGFADGDGAARRENGRKAHETCLWKALMIRHGLAPSYGRRSGINMS